MIDPSNSSMHQRRRYEVPGAGFPPPQHYYPPYVHYSAYQPNTIQHYPQSNQQQWHYYNAHLYTRPPPPYQPTTPYAYPSPNNFSSRPSPMQSPYAAHGQAQSPHDIMHAQSAMQTSLDAVTPARPLSPHVPPPDFSGHRAPYYPPLPWVSVPDEPFPPRCRQLRRRHRLQSASNPVELPNRESVSHNNRQNGPSRRLQEGAAEEVFESGHLAMSTSKTNSNLSLQSHPEEKEVSSIPSSTLSKNDLDTSTKYTAKSSTIIPVVPNISSTPKDHADAATDEPQILQQQQPVLAIRTPPEVLLVGPEAAEETATNKTAPKSWAELLRRDTITDTVTSAAFAQQATSGSDAYQRRIESLGSAIDSFVVKKPSNDRKIAFLEPRGLINSGNMCYMNSVLQVLVFCVPFYRFLAHVARHAVYSFKSDTPLLDAMIMFMKEFPIIDTAESAEKLRMRLKSTEIEQFGEPFLPEYVYDEIRKMARFSTMQRGHQQDAEEFLGFLFEELQGECSTAIRRAGIETSRGSQDRSHGMREKNEDTGWLEVGPRQKAATTRSSGVVEVDTPINRIFGGELRSELRVPGAKNSVTLEPYQSLQLDIGSPEVRNITDALRGLMKPETLHGDFRTPRGSGVTATKQVFIESLPLVLILHLKRFQYDNTGGTQKIWKKVGYPLELEIPKESFPHAKRGSLAVQGALPRYRLISVIYHHGKSATAGHYTTDILRQDGREWIRIDDTFLRRVRSQDVESAAEDDTEALVTALEQHRRNNADGAGSSEDSTMGEGEQARLERGWSQAKSNSKKWSGVVDGTTKSSGMGTPTGPQSLKDNKVAYILLYERVGT